MAATTMFTWSGLVAPTLYGTLVATLLSGICINQIVIYVADSCSGTGSGRRFDHSIVSVCSIAIFALTAVDFWNLHDIFLLHATDTAYATVFHAPSFSLPLVAACSSFASQLWFLERAWRSVGKNYVFLLFAFLPMLGSLAGGLGIFVVGRLPNGNWRWMTLERLSILWMWSNALGDVIITSAISWKVRSVRKNTERRQHKARSNPFRDIARLSFATGALTSIAALVAGAVYLATWTYSELFVAFYLLVPRLSVLSLLITLNFRRKWRATIGGGSDSSEQGVIVVQPCEFANPHPPTPHHHQHQHHHLHQQQQADLEKYIGGVGVLGDGGVRPTYKLNWTSNHERSPLVKVKTESSTDSPDLLDDIKTLAYTPQYGLVGPASPPLLPSQEGSPTTNGRIRISGHLKGTWDPRESEIGSVGDLERTLSFNKNEFEVRAFHPHFTDESEVEGEKEDEGDKRVKSEIENHHHRDHLKKLQHHIQSNRPLHQQNQQINKVTLQNKPISIPPSAFRRSTLFRHGRQGSSGSGSAASGISVLVETTREVVINQPEDDP